jgi:aspartyl protease family protein
MLGWAFRYLAVAAVAAVLFAILQGREWASVGVAARHAVGDGQGKRASRTAPERDEVDGDGGDLEQVIRAGTYGHFLVEAVVNGVPIDFMIDTGASHVVLTLDDAAKIGFTGNNLQFTQEFESANGTVRAAPVELRELRIGQLQLFDLEASVNGGPLPISLLGMSFLRRLRGYEVARDRLVLRW